MKDKNLEVVLNDKAYSVDTDGCGCVLVGVAAIILAQAIGVALTKYGWPF